MSTLERAIAIAAEAHAGQVDKLGEPYILHPLRVMMRLDLPDDMIVAVLHDVVEDCPDWPLARIRDEGFSPVVIGALDALTKRGGVAYGAYIDRIRTVPLARRVKLADISDNIDPARIGRLPEPDQDRLRRKYGAAERALF